MKNKNTAVVASVCERMLTQKLMKVTVASTHNVCFVFFSIPVFRFLFWLLLVFFLLLFRNVCQCAILCESSISLNLFGFYRRSACLLSQFCANSQMTTPQEHQRMRKSHEISSIYFTFMEACTFAPSAIKSFTMLRWPPWHATNNGEPPSYRDTK